MICNKCNKKNDEDSLYCEHCGSKMNTKGKKEKNTKKKKSSGMKDSAFSRFLEKQLMLELIDRKQYKKKEDKEELEEETRIIEEDDVKEKKPRKEETTEKTKKEEKEEVVEKEEIHHNVKKEKSAFIRFLERQLLIEIGSKEKKVKEVVEKDKKEIVKDTTKEELEEDAQLLEEDEVKEKKSKKEENAEKTKKEETTENTKKEEKEEVVEIEEIHHNVKKEKSAFIRFLERQLLIEIGSKEKKVKEVVERYKKEIVKDTTIEELEEDAQLLEENEVKEKESKKEETTEKTKKDEKEEVVEKEEIHLGVKKEKSAFIRFLERQLLIEIGSKEKKVKEVVERDKKEIVKDTIKEEIVEEVKDETIKEKIVEPKEKLEETIEEDIEETSEEEAEELAQEEVEKPVKEDVEESAHEAIEEIVKEEPKEIIVPKKSKKKDKKRNKKEKKKVSVLLIIILSIFLIVGGCVGFYFLYRVEVPSMIGLNESEAISILKKSYLKYNINYEEVYEGKDLVTKQSLKDKSKVRLFSTITITVVKAKDYSNATWSEWVDELPEEIDEDKYIIEEKISYSYRDKELAVSRSKTMSGYTLYDTEYLNEYTPWSSWSTTAVKSSNTRKVDTKIEYSSRTKSKSTYWSDWSSYSTTKETADGTSKEERTRTTYKYFYFPCRNGYRSHDSRLCHNWACYYVSGVKKCGDNKPPTSTNQTMIWTTTKYSYSGGSWQGTGTYIISINGDMYFYRKAEEKTRTEYSYRSLKEKLVYSNWSAYSDTKIQETDSVEVRTITYYRYQDKIPEYKFYRWKEWSEYSDTEYTANSDREVKTITQYKYTEK